MNSTQWDAYLSKYQADTKRVGPDHKDRTVRSYKKDSQKETKRH